VEFEIFRFSRFDDESPAQFQHHYPRSRTIVTWIVRAIARVNIDSTFLIRHAGGAREESLICLRICDPIAFSVVITISESGELSRLNPLEIIRRFKKNGFRIADEVDSEAFLSSVEPSERQAKRNLCRSHCISSLRPRKKKRFGRASLIS
jgi:hypothetical protein